MYPFIRGPLACKIRTQLVLVVIPPIPKKYKLNTAGAVLKKVVT